jgi:biotin operon repressor
MLKQFRLKAKVFLQEDGTIKRMWFHVGIMRPIYVGKLSEKESKALEKGLKSSSAFTVRRCQILLKSAKGERASQIAYQLHCSDQAVRNTIRAYKQQGLAVFKRNHMRDTINRPQLMSQAVLGLKKSFGYRLVTLITKRVSGHVRCWRKCYIRKGTPAK